MTISSIEQKKLLELLMGRQALDILPRDFKSNYELKKEQESIKDRSYHIHTNTNQQPQQPDSNPSILNDYRICKSFIVGRCPYDLFLGTKQDFGRCKKTHLQKHKMLYESFVAQGFEFEDFEFEYMKTLERFLDDCNSQIAVAIRRLEHTPEEKEKLSALTKELDAIDLKIGLTQQELQVLLKNNEVAKSVEVSLALDSLIKQRQQAVQHIRDLSDSLGQSSQQKLQVCEVCALYLSRLDSDKRLLDHFVGKIHLGYVFMRAELKRLRLKNIKY